MPLRPRARIGIVSLPPSLSRDRGWTRAHGMALWMIVSLVAALGTLADGQETPAPPAFDYEAQYDQYQNSAISMVRNHLPPTSPPLFLWRGCIAGALVSEEVPGPIGARRRGGGGQHQRERGGSTRVVPGPGFAPFWSTRGSSPARAVAARHPRARTRAWSPWSRGYAVGQRCLTPGFAAHPGRSRWVASPWSQNGHSYYVNFDTPTGNISVAARLCYDHPTCVSFDFDLNCAGTCAWLHRITKDCAGSADAAFNTDADGRHLHVHTAEDPPFSPSLSLSPISLSLSPISLSLSPISLSLSPTHTTPVHR